MFDRWPGLTGGDDYDNKHRNPLGMEQQESEQLAMVEFDDELSNAVVRVLTLQSGQKTTIAVLNASIISGEPRWSHDGGQMAFAGFEEGNVLFSQSLKWPGFTIRVRFSSHFESGYVFTCDWSVGRSVG